MPNEFPFAWRRSRFQANGVKNSGIFKILVPVQEVLEIILQAMGHHLRRAENPIKGTCITPLPKVSVHRSLRTSTPKRDHMPERLSCHCRTKRRSDEVLIMTCPCSKCLAPTPHAFPKRWHCHHDPAAARTLSAHNARGRLPDILTHSAYGGK